VGISLELLIFRGFLQNPLYTSSMYMSNQELVSKVGLEECSTLFYHVLQSSKNGAVEFYKVL
jgi:hypothetical protein